MTDIYVYSIDNVLAQTKTAPATLGYYELRFYTEEGRPSKHPAETLDVFYYYPSGGTIRDKDMNIIFYEPKLDLYKNFRNGL